MTNEKRLIDANAFAEKLKKFIGGTAIGFVLVGALNNEPTVDAVEVVHGRWIMVIDENDCECIECPLCGGLFYDGDNDTFDKPYNYCPNCGAKMDGDGNA